MFTLQKSFIYKTCTNNNQKNQLKIPTQQKLLKLLLTLPTNNQIKLMWTKC